MKLATWNVNSLRVRVGHLAPWLKEHAPDIVCLQETKIVDDDFPHIACQEWGYHAVFSGQKSYNGVAILSRTSPRDVVIGIPAYDDAQRRVLAASFGELRVINAYIPNGSSVGSEKYIYKLQWLDAFVRYVEQALKHYPLLVVTGDFNIAPEDRDVHDPAAWVGAVMVSPEERVRFQYLLQVGMVDVFRRLQHDAGHFTWWDYRQGAFRRNLGLRIDHILASPSLAAAAAECVIDVAPRRLERPSDHAPVMARFEL